MFTVLHEKPDGSKDFHRVGRPIFAPKPDRLECIIIPDAGPQFQGTLYGGRVFIMNDKGNTVATFRLESEKVS